MIRTVVSNLLLVLFCLLGKFYFSSKLKIGVVGEYSLMSHEFVQTEIRTRELNFPSERIGATLFKKNYYLFFSFLLIIATISSKESSLDLNSFANKKS